VAPLCVFGSFYVATLLALTWFRFPLVQWSGLLSVSVATALTILFLERQNGWDIGLLASPRVAVPEFLQGLAFGAVLIVVCSILVSLTTAVSHVRGAGFPWLEVAGIYLPAALHEELLFRGYAFQKLLRWNRAVALFGVAALFAAVHIFNDSVSWLGVSNIFLGGIVLGLAYQQFQRLWFPIGLHLAWNVTLGPILGDEVSGYDSLHTVLAERGSGAAWLTGGRFGLEGSAWMTVTELAAIAILAIRLRKRERLRG
jgi:membrane protease YdiL (CAAX protease family)